MHIVFSADIGATAAATRGTSGFHSWVRPKWFCGGRGSHNSSHGSSFYPGHSRSNSHSHSSSDGFLCITHSQRRTMFFPSGHIQCQIYNHHGHYAIDYFSRLNMAYEGRVPATPLHAYVTSAYPSTSATTLALQN